MSLTKSSLVYTKRESQVFACLINAKHNDIMDIASIRRSRLRLWFSNKSIPESEKSYISQLIHGKASFGEKAARRLEKTYKMPDKYLDSDEQQPVIDLSNVSLEKLEFMKEIAAMDDEEFHAKAGVFKAVAAVPTKKESNHDD